MYVRPGRRPSLADFANDLRKVYVCIQLSTGVPVKEPGRYGILLQMHVGCIISRSVVSLIVVNRYIITYVMRACKTWIHLAGAV